MVGVGALASAQVPGHNIIYTPADISIDTRLLRSTLIPIKFDHGANANFYLGAAHFTDFFSGGLGFAAYGRLYLSAGNVAIGSHAIPKGEIVDKAGTFKSVMQTLVYATSGSYKGATHKGAQGAFQNITNKYLGVHISINGQVHEGWIRMTIACTGADVKGAISGYAYDTVPNEVGLAAGQIGGKVGAAARERVMVDEAMPASRGVLAAGSSAIPYWRQ